MRRNVTRIKFNNKKTHIICATATNPRTTRRGNVIAARATIYDNPRVRVTATNTSEAVSYKR